MVRAYVDTLERRSFRYGSEVPAVDEQGIGAGKPGAVDLAYGLEDSSGPS